MPSFSHRTLYVSLSAIVLVFLTALTLTPRPDLNTLSIPSPFSRSDNHQSPCPSPLPPSQQKASSVHYEQQQQQQQQQPTWLLATVSAYSSQRRRNIIRATWQTLYRNPAFDTRFVIAQPSALWLPLIKHENDTYGDLIILADLEESASVANTIKSIEFLKQLVSTSDSSTAGSAPWGFVSKIDDDSFLSASRFYQEFLLPRIPPPSQQQQRSAATTTTPDDNTTTNQTNALIARRLIRPTRPFDTPGGQFYTLSFPLVRILARAHRRNPRADLAEDVLIGQLLYDSGAEFEFVELDDTRAFDISDDDGGGRGGGIRRLSKEKEDLGPMDGEALNPHKMKDDETYLRVAGMFGEAGFVGEGGAG